jgi:hypothetical protein
MNGQERAEQNFLAFQTWDTAKTDADFREMVMQGRLNRGEVSRECAFGRSVLVQNPRIKEALHELEEQLRARGVLPAQAPPDTLPLRAKGRRAAEAPPHAFHRQVALADMMREATACS